MNQESVATGRNRSYSNYMGGGASYQVDPRTTVRGGALWVVQHFQSEDLFDSDTYGLDLAVDRAFTPRFTGTIGYEYRFFDIQNLPDTTTHTPRLGVRFRFTETITGTLSAGPTIETGSISRVTPAVIASLSQRYGWGNISLDYTRAVGTAGGLGGTSDNQSGGATVQLTSLMPRLVVQGGPRYNSSVSPNHSIDVQGFTLPVQATYRLQTGIALIAAYQFFHQRSESRALTPAGTAIAADADQNRVWVGIQFGYPFKFEYRASPRRPGRGGRSARLCVRAGRSFPFFVPELRTPLRADRRRLARKTHALTLLCGRLQPLAPGLRYLACGCCYKRRLTNVTRTALGLARSRLDAGNPQRRDADVGAARRNRQIGRASCRE